MNCKFCSSDQIVIVNEIGSHVNQNRYHLYECKACGSRFFDINQHPEELQSMYNHLSFRDTFSLDFKQSSKWLDEKHNIISVLRKKPDSVLDVGCRTGDFLMHFKNEAYIEGIELSEEFSSIAVKRGLKVHKDFIENINFDRKYDVVSCYAILEHLNNPFTFLEKLETIVTKGGLLIIMIPTHQSLKESFYRLFKKKTWHMYSPPEHLNFYSKKFLDSYLGDRGFKLVKRYYSSGGMTISSNTNPLFNKLEVIFNYLVDKSFLSRFPIFDHMFSYYKLS